MTRPVAITGVGIVSSLGCSFNEVTRRLLRGESGIRAVPEWAKFGMESLVAGTISGIDDKARAAPISKRLRPAMSDAALYCSLSAIDAVADAGLTEDDLQSSRTGCIVGSGTGSVASVYESAKLTYSGRIRRVSPFTVLRCMSSSASAAVSNLLKIRGPSYSIGAACATSTHNIGHAFSLIRSGVLDIAIAGGGEDLNELIAASFQGMRVALSTKFNDVPKKASRPFDVDRDGFVLTGGGGIVVLEALDRALARRAAVHAELVGYAATSDGYDLVVPEPTGAQAAACMRTAINDAGLSPEKIDYVNAHATSTVAGDKAEIKAIRSVFGDRVPPFSSTKSMTGHAIGAAGVHEVIYCIAMLKDGFLAPSINIDKPDPIIDGLSVVTEAVRSDPATILTNNFGFGGTNGCLVLRRMDS